MTNEEVGAFIRLLCIQWTKGGIPNDTDRISRMAGAIDGPSLGYVLAKFRLCEDGQLKNDTMEEIRAAQSKFRQSQAEKGKKGALKRWKDSPCHTPAIVPAIAGPMANASPTSTSTSTEYIREKFKKPTMEELKLHGAKIGLPDGECEKFFHFYESKGWMVGKSKMKSWQSSMINWRKNWQERGGVGSSGNTRSDESEFWNQL